MTPLKPRGTWRSRGLVGVAAAGVCAGGKGGVRQRGHCVMSALADWLFCCVFSVRHHQRTQSIFSSANTRPCSKKANIIPITLFCQMGRDLWSDRGDTTAHFPDVQITATSDPCLFYEHQQQWAHRLFPKNTRLLWKTRAGRHHRAIFSGSTLHFYKYMWQDVNTMWHSTASWCSLRRTHDWAILACQSNELMSEMQPWLITWII